MTLRLKVGCRDRGKALAAPYRSWVCSPNREYFGSEEFSGWTVLRILKMDLNRNRAFGITTILIDLVLYGFMGKMLGSQLMDQLPLFTGGSL